MSEKGTFKIAVLSDLHIVSSDHLVVTDSHLKIGVDAIENSIDPLSHLKKLIGEKNLTANLVLSPGDLGNKADPDGFRYAWQQIHDVGKLLKADQVFGTCGNHDVDSKLLHNGFDCIEAMQSVIPNFPFNSDDLNNKFWARKYAIFDGGHYRLLIFNSSGFHGGSALEANHGRISNWTLSQIEKDLSAVENPPPINIFLCHHHPHAVPELKMHDGSYDKMLNGEKLTDLLSTGNFGEWIIIHGHKHIPRLAYAQGSNNLSPLVFGAGSFSAHIYPQAAGLVRNLFHIISVPLDLEFGIAGNIETWEWSPTGWTFMPIYQNKYSSSPFGYRGNLRQLVKTIESTFNYPNPITWKELVTDIPDLGKLMFEDFEFIKRELKKHHNILVDPSEGSPAQIWRTS